MIKQYLSSRSIVFKEHTHPPVFTVEEAKKHCSHIPGMHCKNLFLKDKRLGYVLVVMPAEKQLRIDNIRKMLGGQKMSFASPDELKQILGLEPGAVSPFGLINDEEHKCLLVIDKEVWEAEIVNFHPNVNTASLEMAREDFRKYVNSLENSFRVVEISLIK